jgi:hypothetical protein
MKTQLAKTTRSAKWAAALGLAALSMTATGCMMTGQDERVSSNSATWIAGQVQGDSASLEGAVVTTQEVDSTGVVGPVVDTATVEADGSFHVRTKLRGVRFLVIRIAHHGKVLKARLEDRIAAGDSLVVGTVNDSTTVETEVRVKLRGSKEGREALGLEIRAAIQAMVKDSAFAGFRGDSTARAQLIAVLDSTVRANSKARVEAVADLVRRAVAADSLRPDSTRPPLPRPDLAPCARAALLIAAMDPADSATIEMKGEFAEHCLIRDSVGKDDSMPPPPPPQSCREVKDRIEIVGSGSAEGVALGLDLAARCDSIAPPIDDKLKPCERDAIRLAAMATTDPAYAALRASFAARCLDDDTTNDDKGGLSGGGSNSGKGGGKGGIESENGIDL